MTGAPGLIWGAPGLAIAAAVAVALPILIHLLLRRRRLPIEWAAMELLREAVRRVERKRRLERYLLLAVRCLLVACAGLAIAQPIIGAALVAASTPRTLVVVVDDSIAAAERLSDGATALDWATRTAREAIERLDARDRVAVVLASRGATEDIAPASLDRRAAMSRLASLEPSQRGADLPGAVGVAARILEMEESRGTDGSVLVVSALRAGSVGSMPPMPLLRAADAGARAPVLEWAVPPAAQGANLQLAGLEPIRMPGAGAESQRLVRVTVRRDRGDGEQQTTLRIAGPTLVAPIERVVRLAAGERERTLDLAVSERPDDATIAVHGAVLASISADAQPEDDSRAAVLGGAQQLRVGIVDRRNFSVGGGIDQLPAGEWVARALAPGDAGQIDVSTTDPAALDARALAALDAVVIAQPQLLGPEQWALMAGFVARGGTVVVLPAQGERAQAWTGALRETFGVPWTIGLEARDVVPPQPVMGEQVGRGIVQAIASELPQLGPSVQVSRMLPVDPGTDQASVQLSLADGQPLVLAWRPAAARGQVVLFTAAMDLAWTTLPVKPLMVPLWQEVVSESARMATAARTVRVGADPWIDRAGVVELRLTGADGAPVAGVRTVQVGAGGRVARSLDRAGVYDMLDGSGRVLGVLATVVDDAAASVQPSDMDRLDAWLGPHAIDGAPHADAPASGGVRATAATGTDLALWLLIAAAALAIVESLLARRFSHANAQASRAASTAPRIAAGGMP